MFSLLIFSVYDACCLEVLVRRLLSRLQAPSGESEGNNVSADVSRCYGDCSSALLGDQLQRELVDRLEIQQLTSTTTRYQQHVVDDVRHHRNVVILHYTIYVGLPVRVRPKEKICQFVSTV